MPDPQKAKLVVNGKGVEIPGKLYPRVVITSKELDIEPATVDAIRLLTRFKGKYVKITIEEVTRDSSSSIHM